MECNHRCWDTGGGLLLMRSEKMTVVMWEYAAPYVVLPIFLVVLFVNVNLVAALGVVGLFVGSGHSA